jgi:hypothetical protein
LVTLKKISAEINPKDSLLNHALATLWPVTDCPTRYREHRVPLVNVQCPNVV